MEKSINMQKDIVIVSACRTAIGTFGGSLKDTNAASLASIVMKEAIKRAGIDSGLIDDIRFGNGIDHHDYNNVSRIGALMAGVPYSVTACTMNRNCPSAMEAVVSGVAMIQAGMADIIMAGGTEHMSSVPYVVENARWGCRLQDQVFVDALMHNLFCGSRLVPFPEDGPLNSGALFEKLKGKPYNMGITAEVIAELHNISREEMDQVALRSHNNAERATKEGDFKDEIVPVEIPQRKGKAPIIFDKDEHFRPGVTMEQLAALPPAFIPKTGKVTAGNSSGLNDGASAIIFMSAEKARELGLKPLARIKATGRGGCHPTVMGMSPVPAFNDLSKRSGLEIQDFELIELNEAFAAQYIGCEREMKFKREIANVNGSGIGLGHPVGSTGCRLIVTLMYAMKKRGKTLGLATLCGGSGLSVATAIEML